MPYDAQGVKFVLTAPDTESTEQAFSPWKQMVYASAPARYVPRMFYKKNLAKEWYPDGSAKVMPYGVRVTEEILIARVRGGQRGGLLSRTTSTSSWARRRSRSAWARTTPSGRRSPPASTRTFFGSTARPINAAESERIYKHPSIRRHRPKVIVGGAGSWQIEKTGNQEQARHRLHHQEAAPRAWCSRCSRSAESGDTLPKVVDAPEPTHRSNS